MPNYLKNNRQWSMEFPFTDFADPNNNLVVAGMMKHCRDDPDSRKQLISPKNKLKRHILEVIAGHFCKTRIYPSSALIYFYSTQNLSFDNQS